MNIKDFHTKAGLVIGSPGFRVFDPDANLTARNISTDGVYLSAGVDIATMFSSPNDRDRWNTSYTLLTANSADWQNTYTVVSGASADWSSTTTTVSTNSASWELAYSSVTANSAAWFLGTGGGGYTNNDGGIIAPNSYVTLTTSYAGTGVNIDWTRGDISPFRYDIAFVEEQTDLEYTVLTDHEGRDDVFMSVYNKTVSGFTIESFDDQGPVLREEPTVVLVYGSDPRVGQASVSLPNSALWDLTYTTVTANSAEWAEGGGGGAAAFATDISCDGIAQLTTDTSQVPVNGDVPVLSAVLDDSSVTFEIQWEGGLDNWTDFPTVSGHYITKSNTTALANQGRRFQGTITLDMSPYAGLTTTIPIEFEGTTKYVDVQIAGAGPTITDLQITSSPQYSQDHYKDGDSITFVVEFNTTDVSSVSLVGGNNYATGTVNNQSVTMNGVSATVTTTVDTTITSKASKPIRLSAKNSFGTEGIVFTSSGPGGLAEVLNGPQITAVSFGTYPSTFSVTQTEVRNGQTVPVTFTFDTTNVNQVTMVNTNTNLYASTNNQNITVNPAGSTQATANMTVYNTQSNNTGGIDKRVQAKARKTGGTYGSYGNVFTSSNTQIITVNNQVPTISNPTISYPSGQSALKNSETANVTMTVSNQGTQEQYTYSSPNSQLSIPDTSTYSPSKTVTRTAGTYNISSSNYRLVVNRLENGTSATKNATVFIAHEAPAITISSNNGTRMRSGGSDGTSQQNYTIQMTSSQRLKQAPTITAPHGTLGSFNWSAAATTFTATMGVHDNNTKGEHTYTGLNAVNLAGVSQTNISSGNKYTFGGFISRTVTLEAFESETEINVLWVTYNKLTFSWNKYSSVTTRAPAGTTTQTTDNWCILDQTTSNTGTPGGPITVKILDYSKTDAVSEDSQITIQETI